MNLPLGTFRVTVEVHSCPSQHQAEEWMASTIAVRGPKCACTHGGKQDAWGECPHCKGSGYGPHAFTPVVIPARGIRETGGPR